MHLFLLSVLALFGVSHAQSDQHIDDILSQKRTTTHKLETVSTNTVTLVPSTFAENSISFKESVEKLKELTIVKVYYVYTSYRKSPQFDQKKLDKRRFEQLYALFPEVIENPTIEWEIVSQTGCQSPEMGDSYFHGFIVIHRPIQTENDRLAEINRLEAFLRKPSDVFVTQKLDLIEHQLAPNSTSTGETSTLIPDQEARYAEGSNAMLAYLKKELRTDEIALKRDDQWVKTHLKVDKNGVLSDLTFQGEYPERIKNAVESAIFEMPNWEPAYRDSVPVASELDLEVRVSYSPNVNGMYLINGSRPQLEAVKLKEKPKDLEELYGGTPEEVFMKQAPVYKGLEVMDASERCALVMDVTGSMTDHVASMMRWIGTHEDSLNFTSFTFFNDGDGKPTRKKKIGSTEGIYTTFNLESMSNLVTETMRRGGGGERPESDIEALIHAQAKDTFCTAILLIADNYSEVRDISLLPNIKKPVNLLMCSLKDALRPDYLLIAKNTGGYLIYNGERIELKYLKVGGVIPVGNYQYIYTGSSFTQLPREQDSGSSSINVNLQKRE